MSTFVVYSKENCPFCVKIKNILNLANLNYLILTYETDFTKEEFYEKFGEGSTFPQVVLNEKNLGGCVQTIQYLKTANLLT